MEGAEGHGQEQQGQEQGQENVVREGDTVIVKMHDELDTMMRVNSSTEQKIGKGRVDVSPLVGAPYGSVFEIRGRKLLKIDSVTSQSEEYAMLVNSTTTGDNRSFTDTNTAQKLTDSDIHQLRDQGASAKDIISSLITNSETWNNKTEFSQEKWLMKKQKKYTRKIRVLKATPATLCDVYFRKSNSKICNMRSEKLAQILSHGGVFSGSKVLVFESVVGLVVGSIAYRMRGVGEILAVYFGQQPHFDLVDRLNLAHNEIKVIRPVPGTEIAPAVDFVNTSGFLIGEEATAFFQSRDEQSFPVTPTEPATAKPHHSSGRQRSDLVKIRTSLRQGSNSLIIATNFNPLDILREAIHLIIPSSPIVIYCEFMEPLVECFLYLQQSEQAVHLQILDTWMREFQTLPGRSHPFMNTPTSGGYVLLGTRIQKDMEPITAIGRKRVRPS